jgi:inosine-uridine nucleoside N-ribohydrolase
MCKVKSSKGTAASALFLLCVCLASASLGAPRQVIIDTDPGTDDAIAIMLALNSPELVVRALTVVPGNVTAAQGLDNALRLVSLAHRCDVPVAAGAKKPFISILTTGEAWHGKNGLADIQLPAPTCTVDRRWAPDLIIEMIHAAPHELSLIAIGPLTNIALAVEKDPSITALVKDVIIMGGSISGGNATPAAEFNIYTDPEAAQIVFAAGWTVTMVGLDVCDKTLLTRTKLELLAHEAEPTGRFVYAVGEFLVGKAQQSGKTGTAMYDPLAVGVAMDSTLVQTVPLHVEIETNGALTRGETVANRGGVVKRRELHSFPDGDRYVITGVEPAIRNARVATTVQADRFIDLLVSRIHGK